MLELTNEWTIQYHLLPTSSHICLPLHSSIYPKGEASNLVSSPPFHCIIVIMLMRGTWTTVEKYEKREAIILCVQLREAVDLEGFSGKLLWTPWPRNVRSETYGATALGFLSFAEASLQVPMGSLALCFQQLRPRSVFPETGTPVFVTVWLH